MAQINLDRDTKVMRAVLITENIATDNEISLVEDINGTEPKTYKEILRVRTGYKSFTEYIKDEIDGDVESYLKYAYPTEN